MEIEDIIDYVTTTPENSNPAVLRGMLGQLNNNNSSTNNSLIVHMIWVYNEDEDNDELQLDKTWNEIHTAFSAGNPVIIVNEDQLENTITASYAVIATNKASSNDYQVWIIWDPNSQWELNCFIADTPDGILYPYVNLA